ncbi:alpha/beta hydrolase [Nonomuraea zeae]|uniref:alpha/beta hydrolase n=1 Tax=Nonomuraea zeae TaxID=1642303 RepID=UPI001F11871B|nr:alpha/beta hydrolase fold domain-containing protein [Nonomuraea zeae]
MTKPVLEPAAQAFADATANPPYLYGIPPHQARTAVGDVQRPEPAVPGVSRQRLREAGVTVFRAERTGGLLPVVLYLHGGWVFGDEHTHGRLARELALCATAAVVFVHYSRAPEARYPVALEESGAALDWVRTRGKAYGLDASRIAVAGDSEGGALAAALCLLDRRGLAGQVLFCPVTDASFDTGSYHDFAEGVRGQAPRGARGHHRGALPGRHPRLRHAQRPARHPRRRGGDRPGRALPHAGARPRR